MLRAVFLDIGGVLEFTPPTGWMARWEGELGLAEGDLRRRLAPVWQGGRIGTVSEQEVHRALAGEFELGPAEVDRLMTDFWTEYLGSPNQELIDWFAALRPRYRTGIISNSFVGARERERQRYGFEELTDVIVYSHEVGVAKPDPAIYLAACDGLAVAPDEAAFLDDVGGAVDGALGVGMQAVLFHDTTSAITDVERLLAG